jgi:hypothetical protein
MPPTPATRPGSPDKTTNAHSATTDSSWDVSRFRLKGPDYSHPFRDPFDIEWLQTWQKTGKGGVFALFKKGFTCLGVVASI